MLSSMATALFPLQIPGVRRSDIDRWSTFKLIRSNINYDAIALKPSMTSPLELTPDVFEGANAHAIQIIPKQLGSNATASRWKALHKVRHFTITSQKVNN